MKMLLMLTVCGSLAVPMSASAADIAASPATQVGTPSELTPAVIVQLGPTTPYSTIVCTEFAKLPDGAWKALGSRRFGLGFVQGIIPPTRAIKAGNFIYNNIDLYSQLDAQCAASLVSAKY